MHVFAQVKPIAYPHLYYQPKPSCCVMKPCGKNLLKCINLNMKYATQESIRGQQCDGNDHTITQQHFYSHLKTKLMASLAPADIKYSPYHDGHVRQVSSSNGPFLIVLVLAYI